MSRDTISKFDDIIDSRDIIKRIAELESDRETLADAVTAADADEDEAPDETPAATEAREGAELALSEWDSGDDAEELKALQALQDEAGGYVSDWRHGATLIRDSYFENYARELAEDIGAITKDTAWPCDCIDWEKAATELQQDYTTVEYDGVSYWVRS